MLTAIVDILRDQATCPCQAEFSGDVGSVGRPFFPPVRCGETILKKPAFRADVRDIRNRGRCCEQTPALRADLMALRLLSVAKKCLFMSLPGRDMSRPPVPAGSVDRTADVPARRAVLISRPLRNHARLSSDVSYWPFDRVETVWDTGCCPSITRAAGFLQPCSGLMLTVAPWLRAVRSLFFRSVPVEFSVLAGAFVRRSTACC